MVEQQEEEGAHTQLVQTRPLALALHRRAPVGGCAHARAPRTLFSGLLCSSRKIRSASGDAMASCVFCSLLLSSRACVCACALSISECACALGMADKDSYV